MHFTLARRLVQRFTEIYQQKINLYLHEHSEDFHIYTDVEKTGAVRYTKTFPKGSSNISAEIYSLLEDQDHLESKIYEHSQIEKIQLDNPETQQIQQIIHENKIKKNTNFT